jgi:hypothetical protein
MLHFLNQNYQWIFSGVGVLFVGWLVQSWFKKSSSPTTEVKDSVVTGSAIASGSNISQTVHYHPPASIPAPEGDTHPTPKEIEDHISSLTPYMQHAATEHYVGLPVRWRTKLRSVKNSNVAIPPLNGFVALGIPDRSFLITFFVNIDDYPRLKVAKADTPIEVSGFVEYVDMLGTIMLRDVKLVFLDD